MAPRTRRTAEAAVTWIPVPAWALKDYWQLLYTCNSQNGNGVHYHVEDFPRADFGGPAPYSTLSGPTFR